MRIGKNGKTFAHRKTITQEQRLNCHHHFERFMKDPLHDKEFRGSMAYYRGLLRGGRVQPISSRDDTREQREEVAPERVTSGRDLGGNIYTRIINI